MGGRTKYDITPDGKQFLVVLPVELASGSRQPPREQINVILNWQEELKRLARSK